MKISYVTTYDAHDIHNWSGLGFSIARALEDQGAELDYVGRLNTGLGFRFRTVTLRCLGKMPLGDRAPVMADYYARRARRLLRPDSDLIFSPGTLPIALMKSHLPKVIYCDATFAGMLDFYPDFSNLPDEAVRMGNYLEQKALENCSLAIYSSEWAADSAIRHYGADPKKIRVVPFGANLRKHRTLAQILADIDGRSRITCKLFFPAVQWERKGGDTALQVARALIRAGIPTELHVAGLTELPPMPPFVVNHGFISKSAGDGNQRMEKLFSESHFLILPSRADCTPVVINEASSFGLPSVTTDVGGIPSVVRDGLNGKTFSPDAPPEQYARFIMDHFRDPQNYRRLAVSSFQEFRRNLNWETSGRAIMDMLEPLVSAPSRNTRRSRSDQWV